MKSKTGNKRESTGSKSEIHAIFVAQKLERISNSIPEAAVRRHDQKCPPKKSKTGPCAASAQGPVFRAYTKYRESTDAGKFQIFTASSPWG
ncbi:MAG: hypothetical protein ACLVKM_12600 [Oscillospiraceae bacterium]